MHDYFKCALLLGAVLAVLSLPAIGMVVLRGHWFPRVAVAVGFLALLMPTRAYEPIVMTMAYTLAVAFAVLVVRYLTNWRERTAEGKRGLPPVRYGVRDLLLITLIVAVLTAIASYSVSHFFDFSWLGLLKYIFVGIAFAAVTMSTAWLMSRTLSKYCPQCGSADRRVEVFQNP